MEVVRIMKFSRPPTLEEADAADRRQRKALRRLAIAWCCYRDFYKDDCGYWASVARRACPAHNLTVALTRCCRGILERDIN